MKHSVEILSSLENIDPEKWDALVGSNNPFCSHAFLSALEISGSVGPHSGWVPCHIWVCAPNETTDSHSNQSTAIAAMPLYLKNNSYGEYIFDWSWAEASERAGIPYYPKLVSAVPFTPASGERLLVSTDLPEDEQHFWRKRLLEIAQQLAEQIPAHSVHWLCTNHPYPPLSSLHRRETLQFHWNNPFIEGSSKAIHTFEQWLQGFTTKDRKNIRSERRRAQSNVDRISCVQGHDLRSEQIDSLWAAYQDTASRKWGRPYLTRAFFELLNQRLAPYTLVFFAYRNQEIVASSLCFQRGNHLYGRYWGCTEELPFLHFELCYHQPIEYCLQHGLHKFEAGAQGEHKLKRGLLPTSVHSWHWFQHDGLHQGVGDFLEEEIEATQRSILQYMKHSPLKSSTTPSP